MTIHLVVALAWKSALCAGLTLLLLHLLKARSASERSCVAHVGLVIILLLPVALLVVPNVEVQTPSAVTRMIPPVEPLEPQAIGASVGAAAPESPFSADTLSAFLVAPTLLLFLMTLAAVLRLQLLRRRSEVLIDPCWLTALAAMQQRFGFKHGTALLVSSELTSPISWGVIRPVILLDEHALQDSSNAEAIIAHELAHVARLDWAKLIIGRAATALFWFNPLVWSLARRCHELREEAADDAVLRTNFACEDYAELLVSVARHENRGTLLAANGVAPSRGSLARRVLRVLDPQRSRVPAGLAWSIAHVGAAFLVGTAIAAVEIEARSLSPVASAQPLERVQVQATPPLPVGPSPVSAAEAPEQASPAPAAPASVVREVRPQRPGLLADQEPEVRGRVARALGEAGSLEHSEAIAGLLKDGNPAVRLQAAHALGDLQDPATGSALEAALGDPDPAVRAKVRWALTQVREAETILRRYGG